MKIRIWEHLIRIPQATLFSQTDVRYTGTTTHPNMSNRGIIHDDRAVRLGVNNTGFISIIGNVGHVKYSLLTGKSYIAHHFSQIYVDESRVHSFISFRFVMPQFRCTYRARSRKMGLLRSDWRGKHHR